MPEDIADIYKKISNHPGKRANDAWSNLHATYSGIFVVNRRQLLDLLDRPNHDEELCVELIQNVREQKVKKAFEVEMLRLIHNYIASASSLIDHSRRFITQYSGSTFGRDYDKRRGGISATGEHNFIKDLRNYVVHYAIPPIGWLVAIDKNDKETFTPRLTSATLLEWDKWSAQASQYINEAGEHINLVPLINVHADMIDGFYAWIFEQFKALHGAEIDEVNALILSTLPEDLKKMRGYTS